MPWDIPWTSGCQLLGGPMEQLMVRNMTGPSELQSDAELQIGGQLSVPFSYKGGTEQPEDRWGWEVALDREQASPEATW